jgi:hypothetical protein
VDSTGTFHLLYTAPVDRWTDAALAHPDTVRYVQVSAAGDWSAPERLGSGERYYEGLSLVVDAQDVVHVSFRESHPDRGDTVWHLTRPAADETGEWQAQPVVEKPVRLWRHSLALDRRARPYLAYQNLEAEGYAAVEVASLDQEWRTETLEQAECCDLGEFATLTTDEHDRIHVAYRSADGTQLRYAVCDGLE